MILLFSIFVICGKGKFLGYDFKVDKISEKEFRYILSEKNSFVRNEGLYFRLRRQKMIKALTGEDVEIGERVEYLKKKLSEKPSIGDSPCDYVIITNNELKNAFDSIKAWVERKGFVATIRTVEWISQNYPGFDLADKIRNFLIDAYKYWGISYVLLGGDYEIVPVRLCYFPPYSGIYHEQMAPSDLYFACLDEEWNYDGDYYLGELTDVVHLLPDIAVGRLPFNTEEEVLEYYQKIKYYEEDAGNAIDLLMLAQYPLPGLPPATAVNGCDTIGSYFPEWYRKVKLYNGYNGDYDKMEVIDSLNRGVKFFVGIMHGEFDKMVWGAGSEHMFTNYDMQCLSHYPSIWIICSCWPCAIDKDCLGRYIIRGKDNAIAFIGASRWDYPRAFVNYYMREFANAIFQKDIRLLGDIHFYVKVKLEPLSTTYSNLRFTHLSRNLLGEPLISVNPDSIKLSFCVNYPDTIYLGYNDIKINVKDNFGQPVKDAFVTLKANDNYVRGLTDDYGYVEFKTVLACDTVFLIVFKPGYKLFERKMACSKRGVALKVKSFYINEKGYENGVAEPFETLSLHLKIEKEGEDTVKNLYLKIKSDTLIELMDSVKFISVLSGDTAFQSTFDLLVKKERKINQLIIEMIYSDTTVDTIYFEVYYPLLKVKEIRWDGLFLSTRIKNEGNFGAESIKLVLCADKYSGVFIIDTVKYLGYLEACKDTLIDSGFRVIRIGPPFNLYMYMEYNGKYSGLDTMLVKQAKYETLDVFYLPSYDKLTIMWEPVNALYYNVYEGKRKLNKEPISGTIFEIKGLRNWEFYRFEITAVDSDYNESYPVKYLFRTNPELVREWRYWSGYLPWGGIACYRDKIVLLNENEVYIFSYDGSYRKIGEISGSNWNTPAIGDIDKDGIKEIVIIPSWIDACSLFVYKMTGENEPGFPVPLPSQGFYWASPVLFDIDGDSTLEIIVNGKSKMLVYSCEGELLMSFTKSVSGSHNACAVVADIDDDSVYEFVIPGVESLYVIDANGEREEGFPFAFLNPVATPIGLAVGDVDGNKNNGLEIVVTATNNWASTGNLTGYVYLISSKGDLFNNFPKKVVFYGDMEHTSPPVIADLNKDGRLEIIQADKDNLWVWNYKGDTLHGFPFEIKQYERSTFSSPLVADVDGDDTLEIIIGTFLSQKVYAIKPDGSVAHGFPIDVNGFVTPSPFILDMDGDERNELCVLTYSNFLYIWKLDRGKIEWGSFMHDRWHTGQYGFIPFDEETTMQESHINGANIKKIIKILPTITGDKLLVISKNVKKIKIYDVSGRKIKEIKLRYSREEIDVKELPVGVYFVMPEGGRKCVKFIKIR